MQHCLRMSEYACIQQKKNLCARIRALINRSTMHAWRSLCVNDSLCLQHAIPLCEIGRVFFR